MIDKFKMEEWLEMAKDYPEEWNNPSYEIKLKEGINTSWCT